MWHRANAVFSKACAACAAFVEGLRPQRSYPSQRTCPLCGSPMVYRGSLITLLDRRYLRTCDGCSYTDPGKVKMIREL